MGKIFVAKKYLVTPSVFKLQKWFLHQNGVKFNQKSKSSCGRELNVSLKLLEVRRDALRAEITYDTLVAHSALQYYGKVWGRAGRGRGQP